MKKEEFPSCFENYNDYSIYKNYISFFKYAMKKYQFKSIGSVIECLRSFSFIDYDVVQIGEGKIHLYGKLIANVEFDSELNIPIINFTDEKYNYYNKIMKVLLTGLKNNI